MEPIDLNLERAQRLTDDGHRLLAEQEFERALAIAQQLEDLRYSAGFEVGALAYIGLGDMEAALAILERGAKKAPEVWLNWQLLGNLRSDLGDYENAAVAYGHALSCSLVYAPSVWLNQAIMLNRQGLYADAIKLIEKGRSRDSRRNRNT